jgi:hypothetical protein
LLCSAQGGFYQYAVKFFLQPHDFHLEAALFAKPPIAALMPPLKQACSNADGLICGADGFVFTSFMVTERGAPLVQV